MKMNLSHDIYEKDLPNYRIFWVDDKQLKHSVEKFKAVNDDEAHARLDMFIKSHADHKYYYGSIHYARCLSAAGKIKIRALCEDFDCFEDDRNFFIKILSGIGDFFSYWIWQKSIDLWYKAKDIMYLLKYREARSNQWNLDMHLLDSIELNLPSLIKNSYALMFLDDAIVKLHGNEDGFILEEYHKKHCFKYPEDVEKLAIKIQKEEYSKLLHNVKMYKYLSSNGIIDPDNEDEVSFDKEWRHALPVKAGTYDEFDYSKLNEMCNSLWNEIWDWVKKYGHTLCD